MARNVEWKDRVRRLVRRVVHGRLQNQVNRLAVEVGLPVEPAAGGSHDAFGHAYVSARLTVRLGSWIARLLGELNERVGSDAVGKHVEAEMDRRNNAVGRAIGRRLREQESTSREETARAVRNALDEGRLHVIDRDDEGAGHLVPSGGERKK